MTILESQDLSFYYPEQQKPALDHINFSIEPGEFVVICGPSGSGKSTLLRLLKKEIAPHGRFEGQIYYNNRLYTEISDESHARDFGFVFQDPENQIVMERVLEELIFGLENLGLPTSKMRRYLAEMVHAFGLDELLTRRTMTLSGGQKQLVNLASVLLLDPKVLLLDEPTAQLDPVTAKAFLQFVKQMNAEYGLTVLVVEHRLEDVIPLADRLILMDHGRIEYNGNPREMLTQMIQKEDENYVAYLPSVAKLYMAWGKGLSEARFPLDIKEGRRWLSTQSVIPNNRSKPNSDRIISKNTPNPPIMEARHLDYQYDRNLGRVLDDLSLKIYEGETLAIVGGNGTGKSTLLKVLAGLLEPQRGLIKFRGGKRKNILKEKIGYLPQNPKLFFLHDTVEQELQAMIDRYKPKNGKQKMMDYLEKYNLTHVAQQHPYDLSGGEMQKVALIGVLLSEPEILFIDEPTKGLDPVTKNLFGEQLSDLRETSITLVLVTHDIEFAAKYATRCAMLFQGKVTAEASVIDFFKGNLFYTTSINRLTRNQADIPEVVTIEEAMETWIFQKE